nr:hypothetical protein [bacterium]
MPDEDVVITGTFASGTADYTVTYYYQDENGEYLIASGSIKRNATTDTEVNVTDDDKISQDSGYVFTKSGSVLT